MGLVKADRRIEFTDYVLPICLPFRPIDDIDALENDFVNLAGWGVNPQGEITNQVQGDTSRCSQTHPVTLYIQLLHHHVVLHRRR